LYLLARNRPSTRPLASRRSTLGRPIGIDRPPFGWGRDQQRGPRWPDSTAKGTAGRPLRRVRVVSGTPGPAAAPRATRGAAAVGVQLCHGRDLSSSTAGRRATVVARRDAAAAARRPAPRRPASAGDLPLYLRLRPLLRLGQPAPGRDDDAGTAASGRRPGCRGRLRDGVLRGRRTAAGLSGRPGRRPSRARGGARRRGGHQLLLGHLARRRARLARALCRARPDRPRAVLVRLLHREPRRRGPPAPRRGRRPAPRPAAGRARSRRPGRPRRPGRALRRARPTPSSPVPTKTSPTPAAATWAATATSCPARASASATSGSVP
jgi:hypothetical protein